MATGFVPTEAAEDAVVSFVVVNFFSVCVVSFLFVFLQSEYTEFICFVFFVLMHCEARERFSRPMRSGMCDVDGIVTGWFLYGRENKRIYEIYVECI